MDAYDYLRTGVMNGNPGGFEIPEDIDTEMAIAMLDTCDDIIESHRKTNRAFDVACDPDFALWTRTEYPFDSLRVGMTVYWSDEKQYDGRHISGVITEIGEPSEQRVSEVNEPVVLGIVTKVTVETVGVYAAGRVLHATFTNLDWASHTGYVTVPIPTDGATLGRYPNSYRL